MIQTNLYSCFYGIAALYSRMATGSAIVVTASVAGLQGLAENLDYSEQVAAFYASEFIAESPAGVMAAKNDDQLKQVMAQGYARYRAMGTQEIRISNVRVSPIDDTGAWLTLRGLRFMPARIKLTPR